MLNPRRLSRYGTGWNCLPTNERLAAVTGLSERTWQRADTALRLLRMATEVLRGRQRAASSAWELTTVENQASPVVPGLGLDRR
ncbi:helix-turn-helix domain-containing protein [Mycobacterium asiaticum]|uniref:helix-turn-helix domain-containing protein n=1 Tax=Mycobacterium asiaticum TaxID=1790 RepID=UPI00313FE4D9